MQLCIQLFIITHNQPAPFFLCWTRKEAAVHTRAAETRDFLLDY